MFWGLIMEPQRRYTQVVKKSFHISMAALDISTSGDDPTQVICAYEGRNYLLCTLNKNGVVQCALDLQFESGTEVSFATNGSSHVHLTGYLTDELDLESDGEEEDVEEEEETVVEQPRKKKGDKLENGPAKKQKKENIVSSSKSDEEDESDDSDVDMDKLLNADEDSDDGEEAEDEEDSDDAEEEEDDDEDDEDDDEEEESSEEEVVAPAPKQNGVAKQPKTKKEKQEEAKSKNKKEQQVKAKEQKPVKKVLAGNVLVEDIKEGKGPVAANGKFVHVYYEGRLKQNNKMFDSTKKGPGFGFRLGKGEVIKGWDVGVSGMKVGGKRRITCPPNTAYGAKGSPPVIPPNSTLVFEVELKQVG